MWEVVGFNQRVSKEVVYYDIFLQRDLKAPGQGLQCFAGSYGQNKISYSPRIGDKVVIETGFYEGREYLKDITVIC